MTKKKSAQEKFTNNILSKKQAFCINVFLFLFSKRIIINNPENFTSINDPAIFVFNHNTSIESILIPMYLYKLRGGKKFSFICDWMFGHIPIVCWFFNQINPIYVYNKLSSFPWLNKIRTKFKKESVVGQCLVRLEKGESIGIFPEGTRNRDPFHLLKAKKGLGHIILYSQVSVVPIGIDFPQKNLRKKIPFFGPFILNVGEPIDLFSEINAFNQINLSSDLGLNSHKKIVNYLASVITNKVMQKLSLLSNKKYNQPNPIISSELKLFLNQANGNYNL